MFKISLYNINDLLIILGYIFAIIGFISTIYKAYINWRDIKVISWSESKKYTTVILKKMSSDSFLPDYIVGIGRSGAIVASMISGNIKVPDSKSNIPIIACDRFFKWSENGREEIENQIVNFNPLKNKKNKRDGRSETGA